MKLTVFDCIKLIQGRIEAFDLNTAMRTVEFWEDLEEIVKQGKEQAREDQ